MSATPPKPPELPKIETTDTFGHAEFSTTSRAGDEVVGDELSAAAAGSSDGLVDLMLSTNSALKKSKREFFDKFLGRTDIENSDRQAHLLDAIDANQELDLLVTKHLISVAEVFLSSWSMQEAAAAKLGESPLLPSNNSQKAKRVLGRQKFLFEQKAKLSFSNPEALSAKDREDVMRLIQISEFDAGIQELRRSFAESFLVKKMILDGIDGHDCAAEEKLLFKKDEACEFLDRNFPFVLSIFAIKEMRELTSKWQELKSELDECAKKVLELDAKKDPELGVATVRGAMKMAEFHKFQWQYAQSFAATVENKELEMSAASKVFLFDKASDKAIIKEYLPKFHEFLAGRNKSLGAKDFAKELVYCGVLDAESFDRIMSSDSVLKAREAMEASFGSVITKDSPEAELTKARAVAEFAKFNHEVLKTLLPEVIRSSDVEFPIWPNAVAKQIEKSGKALEKQLKLCAAISVRNNSAKTIDTLRRMGASGDAFESHEADLETIQAIISSFKDNQEDNYLQGKFSSEFKKFSCLSDSAREFAGEGSSGLPSGHLSGAVAKKGAPHVGTLGFQ